MCLDKLTKLNIKDKIYIEEQDQKDFDEILVTEKSLIIIKRYKDISELKEKWEEAVHFTAGYIQNNLEALGFDQVFAWDLYILYLTEFETDLNLVSQIEKNKYCCKKYVINTSTYSDENSAITSRIPLFASLRDVAITYQSSYSDIDMKRKIVEGNDSLVAKSFIDSDFIDDNLKCNMLLDFLKEQYINEKNRKN
jgi:hypothetical protein